MGGDEPSQARLVLHGGDPNTNYGQVVLTLNSKSGLKIVVSELLDEYRYSVLRLASSVKMIIVVRN